MHRIVGICLMVAASTALGFRMSLDLYKRTCSLRELKRVMELIRGEIRYGVTPLNEAFQAAAQHSEMPFGEFLSEASVTMEKRDGKTLAVILEENRSLLQKGTELKDADVSAFVRAGGRLGHLDVEMQMRTIELYLEELEKECAAAEKEYQEKGKVYRYLGFMGGLFLAVVFL